MILMLRNVLTVSLCEKQSFGTINYVKMGASSRWSFSRNSALGSNESPGTRTPLYMTHIIQNSIDFIFLVSKFNGNQNSNDYSLNISTKAIKLHFEISFRKYS